MMLKRVQKGRDEYLEKLSFKLEMNLKYRKVDKRIKKFKNVPEYGESNYVEYLRAIAHNLS